MGGLDVEPAKGSPALAAPLGKDSLDGHLGVLVERQGSMTSNFYRHGIRVDKRLTRNRPRDRRLCHTVRLLSALETGVLLTVRTRCSLVGK